MTLKEKFDVISCKDCDMPYCDIKCTMLSDLELDKLEQIAEEFAIEFAEWLIDGHVSKLTLEEFKKQKETNMCQYCDLENGNHKLSCPVIKITMII
jgi:hypothetical protein